MNDSCEVNLDRKLRIFHGPANIGGTGGYLANWQRLHGMKSDFLTYEENPLIPNSHYCLYLPDYNWVNKLLIRTAFFILCLIKYKIFNFYFGITFFRTNVDLPILKLFRKKVIMTYCGSDIRIMEVEIKRNPYADVLKTGIDDPKYDQLKKMRMYWQKLWVDKVIAPRNCYEHARKIFPENKIIKNVWVHNTMDIKDYTPTNFDSKEIPTIVHAPSARDIKGTSFIEKSLSELKSEGCKFDYICIENSDNEHVQEILKNDADIVIDQIIIGGFGTFAVEGMYYGKPVVGYLIESVKEFLYPDCPIVNANKDNLKKILKNLIKNSGMRTELGKKGRKYVEQNFDRNTINEKLLKVYTEL